jgi:hypothetical protein
LLESNIPTPKIFFSGAKLARIPIAILAASLHPCHSRQFYTPDLMVDKGVRRQFERGLSAESTIANLAAAELVPALSIPSENFRRDRAG